MKNFLLAFLAIGLIGLPTFVFAQEDMLITPNETEEMDVTVPIAPDSPFYFLTSVIEGVDLFLTFNDEAKLDKELVFADRRVAEMDMVAAEGDTELLEKLQNKYEKHIQNAEKIAAKNQEKETEMVKKITQAQEEHIRKLEDVAEKVPLKAKESIDRVIDDTENKFNNANTDNSQSDPTGNGESGNENGSDSSSNGSAGDNGTGGNN